MVATSVVYSSLSVADSLHMNAGVMASLANPANSVEGRGVSADSGGDAT
jgi:hypothetical protein